MISYRIDRYVDGIRVSTTHGKTPTIRAARKRARDMIARMSQRRGRASRVVLLVGSRSSAMMYMEPDCAFTRRGDRIVTL